MSPTEPAAATPKAFVSYAWGEDEEDLQWVLKLARELRESGVDVVIDKWDLREGHDPFHFMERSVASEEIQKVLVVCDARYVERADARRGGVGTETQLISSAVYEKTVQDKFVAVVRQLDQNGQPCLPVFLKSRIYIDLSDSEKYDKNFEQILRWIFNQPLHRKPPLGLRPAFLDEPPDTHLGTSVSQRRALEAVRRASPGWAADVGMYLDRLALCLEEFRVVDDAGPTTERVRARIDEFLPFRDEMLTVASEAARRDVDRECCVDFHRFFEQILPLLRGGAAGDALRFICHEMFLLVTTILIKFERFETLSELLIPYFEKDGWGDSGLHSFSVINRAITSFKSLPRHARGELLRDRLATSEVTFDQMRQAEFILRMKSELDYGGEPEWQLHIFALDWMDIFATLELFTRCESKRYSSKLRPIFPDGVASAVRALDSRRQAASKIKLPIQLEQLARMPLASVTGFARLETKP